ncbi:hypothetical protein Hs30E_11530 [Lactococcus hodotermopsidis]|uniref:F5/8 type C domain-containing protein n=1 Tax=Pseudolactococcus hodotermopsidis TaxID=2709157 RepID=A0A6A0BB71_9LACT|nr:discoidin domain-containing protein [Lactococcus hodotermopsidis]GFH42602.1 hypothetical protein Hs30E_11530 [Lactococcus hodotermopsidis]
MRKTQKYIVAFRTHMWSDTIQEIFDSLIEVLDFNLWELVILTDETNGIISTPDGIEKVSHTADLSAFDLPDIPLGQSLWRNGDYAMQPLVQAIQAPAYIILENDTLVRGTTLFAELADFFDHGGEVVTSKFYHVSRKHWNARTAKGEVLPGDLAQAHVWLWGTTRETAALLLKERQEMVQRSDGTPSQWPVDEIFLGNMILKHNLKIYDVNAADNIKTDYLDYRPAYSLLDSNIWKGNQLVHPAVSQASIFTKYAKEYNWFLKADGWEFAQGTQVFRSMMLSHLDGSNQGVYNAVIRNMYHDKRDVLGFSKLAIKHGLTYDNQLDFANLALHKPVASSLTFSTITEQFAQAESAVDGNLDTDKYRFGGFASRWDNKPWWQIDLEVEMAISQLKLYHREGYFERTKAIDVEVSSDGETFVKIAELREIVFTKVETTRNRQGYAFLKTVNLSPITTRFVRLTNVSDDAVIFNLNQVEIYE